MIPQECQLAVLSGCNAVMKISVTLSGFGPNIWEVEQFLMMLHLNIEFLIFIDLSVPYYQDRLPGPLGMSLILKGDQLPSAVWCYFSLCGV